MVNNQHFAERLEKVMQHHDLSAAVFADRIGVGRSSISHILSGRNKPSLEFVMKVIKTFPEVELYWLLNGKGNFPKSSEKKIKEDSATISKNEKQEKTASTPTSIPIHANSNGKNISRIVIFYDDGSFDAFEN